MSEPLSSVEIEDVLSSIRRLVSEDLRPLPRGAVAPEPPVVQKPALILTPALRVVPQADPVTARAEPSPDARIEDVVAAVSAAVDEKPEEWEPETGDAAPDLDSPWDDGVWAAAGEEVPAAAAPGATAQADAVLVLQAEARQDVAEDVLPVSEAGPVAPSWAQVGAEEAFVFHSSKAPRMPAGPAEDAWLDQAEAEVIAQLQPESPAATSFDPLDDTPEMTFDEEVLRDLVRDLIREELQGQLGERITRNIRKLVRAEIARALAAAEFDAPG